MQDRRGEEWREVSSGREERKRKEKRGKLRRFEERRGVKGMKEESGKLFI